MTTDEILDEELSENMLDILKDIPIMRDWIKQAMVRYADLYHNEQLQTLQASTDKSKLLLADVSNRRELLIAFADAINVCDGDKRKIRKLVDIYLKSN